MNTLFKLLSAMILLSIPAGCEGFFAPPPGYIYMWEKLGADKLEVKKALLECGMPTPYDEDSENREVSINAKATIYACMIQAGFRYKDKAVSRAGGWCYTFKEENLPICQPGAVIPQRSVKKRLNSPYCKKSPVQPECKP
ncbi:hypothetical protein LBE40_05960 [Bartonella taylorii]|uniref:Ig-like domain-containing protein n=1 Tax=Bartonella taylorii 8TBB TaxID=1094560 RepID=A0A9P2W2E6_BARTA|nr:hypothetical protein [Bartonella taylorii]EJF93367.1 hypothetical protein ME9_01343 [Bartonella taylorii 8TBB]USP00831.1 hypothetical protein LBE40_05960 [Bartonella taylorii]